MTEVERVIALKSFAGFAHLSPEDLAVLARHAQPLCFAPGERLLRGGRRVRDLHFVVEGSVEVHGGEHLLATYRSGELVGDAVGLGGDVRGLFAASASSTLTLCVSRSELEDLVEDNFDLWLSVMAALARRVIETRLELRPHAGYSKPASDTQVPTDMNLGLAERIDLLQLTRTFRAGRIEMLSDVAQCAREVQFSLGDRLWSEGDESTHLLILAEGAVDCCAADVAFLRAHADVLGTSEGIAAEPRWYTARAQTAVRAIRLGVVQLVDILEDDSDMALRALRGFADTAVWLQQQAQTKLLAPPP